MKDVIRQGRVPSPRKLKTTETQRFLSFLFPVCVFRHPAVFIVLDKVLTNFFD